ncbi:TonB-dependent receptor [Zoogloea sp.]|uniref:TonB-dependent receptor plug domain-containing protein n=1 Tax=Zoogloea sp. TaxID=49181 RepID=UPI00258935F8|nr:TonB-dependent receptor [Zoogloea sp.]MDD2669481.1 TonB-dependent receptor [Zoogloea sp.]
MHPRRACLLLPALWQAAAVCAAEPPLVDLTLEELVRLDVSAVSRKAQKLSETPAAVTVLSAEEIRRSGARSVPEALREVPGVNVAQIGGGRWAVSVRGLGGRFANKLLVQIDGRSVYSPLFSGVFWEALDVMLEDVERIEVIRGPGASLWGANAVNGVINIVTRKATATRDSLVSASMDDQGRAVTAVRQGIDLDGIGALRVYAKGSELERSRSVDGKSERDRNHGWLAGFRMDGAGSGVDAWMLQGASYRRTTTENIETPAVGGYGGLVPLQFEFEGASLTGRYNWGLADGEASLQVYLDHQWANVATYGKGTVNTADLDFQHRLVPSGRHEVMWGLGSRYIQTEIQATTEVLSILPPRREYRVMSAFVQDEITLVPQTWRLTLGGRFDYASTSRLEPQPTARLMWTPTLADSLWTSWSRAARTPSIGESDATILFGLQPTPPGSPFPAVAVVSKPGAGWSPRAERLDALELGYRRNLGNGSFEAVLFHHDYRRLISETTGPIGPGVIPIPVAPYYAPVQTMHRGNLSAARSTGLELGLDLPVTANLRLQASYTLMDTAARRSADPVRNAYGRILEGSAPHHWASLHTLVNLGRGRELDLMLRRMGAIGQGGVPAYTSVDLRYGWRVNRSFELAVVGQNLFDPLHLEYVSNFFPGQPAYQPRRGYVQGVWRF